MFLNIIFSSILGAGLLLVFTTSVHAKSLPLTDDLGDIQQAVIDLRNSIQNIVNQTAKELDFDDLQDDIAALGTGVAELKKALRESFPDILESYDEASALTTLIRDTLRKAVQQNPDVAALILKQGLASGPGSKLTLAIDMADVLEKELDGGNVITIERELDFDDLQDDIAALGTGVAELKKALRESFPDILGLASGPGSKLTLAIDMADVLEKELDGGNVITIERDVAEKLNTVSEAVLNTAEWMKEAVHNFINILESSDLEAEDSESDQEQTRQKRSPGGYDLGGGWSLGGHGVQYGRGRWSVSAGPTFGGGKVGGRIGFRIRF